LLIPEILGFILSPSGHKNYYKYQDLIQKKEDREDRGDRRWTEREQANPNRGNRKNPGG
jgi:hypothetical protein